eukprot:CAMPEP_0203926872 /NCGR_PEP_ID=MMETSP0359-20131031/66352_1 /ASSEMBLY_ACC=CAM_ASM_000338 /TAXON_ID=268821 /ORGANISM="Scrippsiella Hangoei, Strain SHTV-5" /LENGTH=41 /DNA_ID= /DNA_START= /DNA_END= /DNA_ORIENTATION=
MHAKHLAEHGLPAAAWARKTSIPCTSQAESPTQALLAAVAR